MNSRIMCLLFLLLMKTSLGSSNFISVNIFDPPRLTISRSLLQTRTNCPVSFEYQNYTIITSQCKGPNYSSQLCCDAFKTFACPFAALLNDESNNCASSMFSYINIYGHYPPGLFNSLCREGREGLTCNTTSNPSTSDDSANGLLTSSISCALRIFTAGLTLFLLWIF